MENEAILHHTGSRETNFINPLKMDEVIRKYGKTYVDSCIIFKIDDVVEFQDFVHLSDKRLTGVIKKLGWSLGVVNPYITLGIKVKEAPFGSALLYNYTIIPSALTKI